MEILKKIHNEYLNILENKSEINKIILENTAEIEEQFDFDSYTVNRSGSAVISKGTKLESPIDGKINSSLSKSSCSNAIVIKSSNSEYFLEYCDVSKIKVSDGEKIYTGKYLGDSTNNVVVTLYDKKGRKVKIDSDDAMKLVHGTKNKPNTKDKEGDNEYKKSDKQTTSLEPLMTGLFQLPFNLVSAPFKNKYNKAGEMTQKRWGSPVDKKPVDPWILQAFKDPFGTKRKKQNNEEYDDLNEEVKRILKLLK
jgi:hypothetical protein